mmetsp:Transcript_20840/g.34377  ORF Transcript_20840/g.34377 Transcript_20840/m.34377 type:complete len:259 (+) Transcript_20840:368-1144(+)
MIHACSKMRFCASSNFSIPAQVPCRSIHRWRWSPPQTWKGSKGGILCAVACARWSRRSLQAVATACGASFLSTSLAPSSESTPSQLRSCCKASSHNRMRVVISIISPVPFLRNLCATLASGEGDIIPATTTYSPASRSVFDRSKSSMCPKCGGLKLPQSTSTAGTLPASSASAIAARTYSGEHEHMLAAGWVCDHRGRHSNSAQLGDTSAQERGRDASVHSTAGLSVVTVPSKTFSFPDIMRPTPAALWSAPVTVLLE